MVVFHQGMLKEKLLIFLINTLLLHIPLLAHTDKQNHRQRDKLILVGLGNLQFLQVNTLLLHIPLLALTDRWNHRQREEYTCCVWAGGTFFQLCCCVSFWFWWETGFGFTYYLCTQSTIQLWCCVSFLVLAGNSFWCFIPTQCNVQNSCAVVSVFWLRQEIVLKMRTRFYKKSYWVLFYDPLADVCISLDLTIFYFVSSILYISHVPRRSTS